MNLEPSLLSLLPAPPPGKTGWPWTEESDHLPIKPEDGLEWPGISIITPSFNQGQFIEETIRSIILQNYPMLEYIIIDGGSTDDTLRIIEKYNNYVSFWVSEPDNGQSHAINKGFLKCTGLYVNWICSDDILCKNALNNAARLILKQDNILLLGSGFRIDIKSEIIDKIESSSIDSFEKLVDIRRYWRNKNSILQQSTLYPVKAVKKCGLLLEEDYYTMDFDLWGKLLMLNVSVKRTEMPIGMFRWYGGQKTSNQKQVTRSLTKAARRLIVSNESTSHVTKMSQLFNVSFYNIIYVYRSLRSSLGVKRRIQSFIYG